MLEWFISSAALTALVIALRYALRGKIGLRLQYALWALALLRLLIPVSLGTSRVSLMNALPEERAAAVTAAPAPVQTPVPLPPSPLTPASPAPATPPPEEAETRMSYSTPAPIGNLPVQSAPISEPAAPAEPPDAGRLLRLVWLAGACLAGAWLLFVNLRFALRLRRSRRPLEADCPLPVYVTEAAETPCLFGLLRPAVYLTPGAAADPALDHILAHEYTHYRHGDHIWSLLRGLSLALHWFDPLVWWAAALSRRDGELACDEGTLLRLGEEARPAYGRTLIRMTASRRTDLFRTATTMTGSRGSLRERIKLLAKKPKTALLALIALILIAALGAACTFTGAKAEKQGTEEWFVNTAWPLAEEYAKTAGIAIEKENAHVLRYTADNETDVYFPEAGGDRSVAVYFHRGADGGWHTLETNAVNLVDPGRWQWSEAQSASPVGAVIGFSSDPGYEQLGRLWAEAYAESFTRLPEDNPLYSRDYAVSSCRLEAESLLSDPKELVFLVAFAFDAANPERFIRAFPDAQGESVSAEEDPAHGGWSRILLQITLRETAAGGWSCVEAGAGGSHGWGWLQHVSDDSGLRTLTETFNGDMDRLMKGENTVPDLLLMYLPYVDWNDFRDTWGAEGWDCLQDSLRETCWTQGRGYDDGSEDPPAWGDVYPNDQRYRDMYVMLAALNARGTEYFSGFIPILQKQRAVDQLKFGDCLSLLGNDGLALGETLGVDLGDIHSIALSWQDPRDVLAALKPEDVASVSCRFYGSTDAGTVFTLDREQDPELVDGLADMFPHDRKAYGGGFDAIGGLEDHSPSFSVTYLDAAGRVLLTVFWHDTNTLSFGDKLYRCTEDISSSPFNLAWSAAKKHGTCTQPRSWVTVSSGKQSAYTVGALVSTLTWDGTNLIAGDGNVGKDTVESVAHMLDAYTLTRTGQVELHIADDLRPASPFLRIYNENMWLLETYWEDPEGALAALGTGTYWCGVRVVKTGAYIQFYQKYEQVCYEFLFRLVVPDTEVIRTVDQNPALYALPEPELSPEEAALRLAGMMLEDLKTDDPVRTFRITEYEDLRAEVFSTEELFAAADNVYALQEGMVGDKHWIVELSARFRWEGTLSPLGPSEGDLWADQLYQGGPFGFLLTRTEEGYTLQSRSYLLAYAGRITAASDLDLLRTLSGFTPADWDRMVQSGAFPELSRRLLEAATGEDQSQRDIFVMSAALRSDGAYTELLAAALRLQYEADPHIWEEALYAFTLKEADLLRQLVSFAEEPQGTAPEGTVNDGENMYFVMPLNMANTADGWSQVPFEVYRYTGGETYSLAYAFPDPDGYRIRVQGSRAYYVPLYGGKVACIDLNSGEEQVLGELPSGYIDYLLADGDRVFAIWGKEKQHILYEVSSQNIRAICEDVVMQAELALGDGGLYYIDNADEMALMRYDLSSGESRKVADKVGIGKLEYDGGYVYSGTLDTYRYDANTGEKTFVASWSGYLVRDGWLYYTDYADDSADRDPTWTEILRRNLTDDRIESCGTAYIPYLGDLTLRRSIEFGEKGFIVFITYFKEDTEYMYFPYGASQGVKLSLNRTGADG